MADPAKTQTPQPLLLAAYISAFLTNSAVAMHQIPLQIMRALKALLHRTKNAHKLLTAFLLSLIQPMSSPSKAVSRIQRPAVLTYAEEIERLFGILNKDEELSKLSEGLQTQYLDALQNNEACMLPSYSHLLPSGREKGIYVALDVGGSTFRVAVLELFGLGAAPSNEAWNIMKLQSFPITPALKELMGEMFFDWLAERIEEVLAKTEGLEKRCPRTGEGGNMRVGLSWSFPIEHTNLRSGKIQGMGKGFKAAEGLLGADLADVLQAACDRRDLPLELTATVNDAAATLMSRAYNTPHTHYGLILGTGINMGVHMPISLLVNKLASRNTTPAASSPRSDVSEAASLTDSGVAVDTIDHSHVILNTELSMFGTGLLPKNRLDDLLSAEHPQPDFQPLEMLVSGRYLGEIARLAMVEGTQKHGMFGGKVPKALETSYGLDTAVLAQIEEAGNAAEIKKVVESWIEDNSTISEEELEAIQRIVKAVSKRASTTVAAAIYALRSVRDAAENKKLSGSVDAEDKVRGSGHETVACAGAVIQKYPGFMAGVEQSLEKLYELDTDVAARGRVKLCIAQESSLLGAAVSAAVVAAAGELA